MCGQAVSKQVVVLVAARHDRFSAAVGVTSRTPVPPRTQNQRASVITEESGIPMSIIL